jgi:hypothetical protein
MSKTDRNFPEPSVHNARFFIDPRHGRRIRMVINQPTLLRTSAWVAIVVIAVGVAWLAAYCCVAVMGG